MKKIFVVFFMALIGVGVVFSNAKANEARTIPYKHGVAKDVNTVIVAHGGTLYMVTGDAEDANCGYSIHDASSIGIDGDNTQGTTANTLAEGGEATDEDSLTTLDFRPEGIPFTYGLTIMTSTCNVAVLYR